MKAKSTSSLEKIVIPARKKEIFKIINLLLLVGGLFLGILLSEGLSRLIYYVPPEEPWGLTYVDREGTRISLGELSDFDSIPGTRLYSPYSQF
ncbi:MAG: hypothetical protein ACE5EK_10865, partial [Nitrospinales bacterium]